MKRILFMLILVMGVLVACSEDDKEEKETERVTPVELGEVTQGNLTMDRTFYGRTTPNQTTPIVPTVAGKLEELEVENGDQVEEGDRLALVTSPQGNIAIDAPMDGTITGLQTQEGGLVSNQEPFASIVDLEQLTVQLQVPDVQLDLFEEGNPVHVTLKAAEKEEHEATIEYVASTANEAGLFPIDLSFDNATTHYNAGVTAIVSLEETVVENALLIPTAALVEADDETFVYTVNDNTAKKVAITVQATQSDLTAVKAELNKGDKVITSGQLTLADGSKISIIGEE